MSDKKEKIEMTAGEMLLNARTNGRRKRELATISRQLCIKEEFLDALEKGDYAQIPELVYILGFARNYAMEVGLDPEVIVKKIKTELGILSEEDEEGEDATNKEDEQKPVAKVVKQEKKKITNNPNSGLKNVAQILRKHWKWLLGAIILIILVVIVAVMASGKKSQDAITEHTPEVSQSVLVEPEYSIGVKDVFGTASPNTQIIMQATAETWLKVEDTNGETLFSRVLAVGDVYYVPTGGAIATVGNAGGLDIWVNAKPAPKLGGRGEKRSGIQLTPDALMKE